jgi:phage baseplate assembly protein W
MTTPIFSGYSGAVWQSVYASICYYQAQLTAPQASANPASVISLSEVMLQTLLNADDAIVASAMAAAWAVESTHLTTVSTFPLGSISPVNASFFNNRLASYDAATPALTAIVPATSSFLNPFQGIANGIPAIPPCNLLGFFAAFNYETPPVGLNAANFAAQAQGVASAFAAVAVAVQIFQGVFPTQAYDTVTQEENVANAAAYLISSFTSGTVASGSASAWNQIVALPAMTMSADIITGAPVAASAQQQATIRYAMLSLAAQIAEFLATAAIPTTGQVNTATLMVGQNLLDVAAQALGNYELWPEIAALNNLLPPYVGAVAAPGIAAWGTQLLLPSPGTQMAANGVTISYDNNVLGTDLYVGPINGDMPAWEGDFQSITGYSNLAWALGRRLQTALGSLVFHPDYGSRIPPEVGMVLDDSTAGHIAAYGKSALLNDPRVQSVTSALSNLIANQGVSFSATVQPIGIGSTPTQVNQVIVSPNQQG